ncbi:hypothetical protein B0I27_11195 [Arcticibacter pallidicorallinus]|uniref:Outer membrane protein with beta-barrel domain n=1 Tax=Arcticibacter pallidicorallinus TaxID=1259464 RepID=A0A2T0TV48_9SPHI|nr:hypothetical protein [Arcticibacter pallidicorallinus]PRY49539.1 hypothetical protein B0I27_11195 [Arcticibacter pallidicorallinus]
MKNRYLILFSALFIASTAISRAQSVDSILGMGQEILQKERIFSVKGIGMAFPIGGVSDVLRPRFSSSIGLQILAKNRKHFLYPSLDYLNYKYDQINLESDYDYKTRNANATFYMGSIAYGYMKNIKKFRIFGSAGVGAGILNEPRSRIDVQAGEVNYSNKSSLSGIIKLNTGLDYGARRFKFFAELSYMQNTRKIQGHNLQTFAVNVGTKTNLFRLARSIDGIRKK